MFKNINAGKRISQFSASIKRGLDVIPRSLRAIPRGYAAASNWAYEMGRFNPHVPFSHTSTHPHLYDEMHLPLVKDIPGMERLGLDPKNITVSIPFEMRGQKIRALKTSKVDASGRSRYPRLLVIFRDVHPEFLGDETILVQPGGSAQSQLRLDDANLTWMVWQPRRIKIVNKRREVYKTQAEIDAFDIARELSRYIKEGSNNQIVVNPNTMLSAIDIFTRYSPPLQTRWKILSDRYAFMRHLTMRPHAVAALLRSIIEMPSQELLHLIDEIEAGEIQTWSGFLDAINHIPNVNAIAGGAAIAEQHGMRTSLVRSEHALAENIPPSIFVSSLGLPYFLAYLDAREKRIEPNIKALAEDNARVVEAMIHFHRRFAQIKLEAIQAGTQQLEAGQGKLIAAAEQSVRELLDLQEQQFRGNLIIDVPKRAVESQEVVAALPSSSETPPSNSRR